MLWLGMGVLSKVRKWTRPGLPLTVTIRVSRVSAMVSARFSVH